MVYKGQTILFVTLILSYGCNDLKVDPNSKTSSNGYKARLFCEDSNDEGFNCISDSSCQTLSSQSYDELDIYNQCQRCGIANSDRISPSDSGAFFYYDQETPRLSTCLCDSAHPYWTNDPHGIQTNNWTCRTTEEICVIANSDDGIEQLQRYTLDLDYCQCTPVPPNADCSTGSTDDPVSSGSDTNASDAPPAYTGQYPKCSSTVLPSGHLRPWEGDTSRCRCEEGYVSVSGEMRDDDPLYLELRALTSEQRKMYATMCTLPGQRECHGHGYLLANRCICGDGWVRDPDELTNCITEEELSERGDTVASASTAPSCTDSPTDTNCDCSESERRVHISQGDPVPSGISGRTAPYYVCVLRTSCAGVGYQKGSDNGCHCLAPYQRNAEGTSCIETSTGTDTTDPCNRWNQGSKRRDFCRLIAEQSLVIETTLECRWYKEVADTLGHSWTDYFLNQCLDCVTVTNNGTYRPNRDDLKRCLCSNYTYTFRDCSTTTPAQADDNEGTQDGGTVNAPVNATTYLCNGSTRKMMGAPCVDVDCDGDGPLNCLDCDSNGRKICVPNGDLQNSIGLAGYTFRTQICSDWSIAEAKPTLANILSKVNANKTATGLVVDVCNPSTTLANGSSYRIP